MARVKRGTTVKQKHNKILARAKGYLGRHHSTYRAAREKTEKAGITRPIAAGIMPFLSKAQITRMIFSCGASLPAEIVRLLVKYENDPESLRSAGIAYATHQILDLLANDVRFIHIYTMNQPDIAHSIVSAVKRGGYIK